MRKTTVPALLFGCALLLTAPVPLTENIASASTQKQNVVAITTLTFENKIHDFGKFSENSGTKSCIFKYKNKSGKPVVIQKVIVSCGCTQVEWSGEPVKPNESGEIKVLFSNQIGTGVFDKSIHVYVSSCPYSTILRVKGEVIGEKTKKAGD